MIFRIKKEISPDFLFIYFWKRKKKLKIKLAIKLAKIPFWLLCNTMPVVSGASHDLELKDRRKHENKKDNTGTEQILFKQS